MKQTQYKTCHTKEEALERLVGLSKSGKKIALTFGHFNTIHPGHLRFLHHAQELAEELVIAIAGKNQLTKSQQEHFFSADERALGIAQLAGVGLVVLQDHLSLTEIIEALKPQIFILGKEFEEERNQEIDRFIETVERQGGKVIFTVGDVHGSSYSIFQEPSEVAERKNEKLMRTCRKHQIELEPLNRLIDKFKDQKILVLGDTIVDQYIACDALGMSAEAPVLAIKEVETKEFIGGAAIVACHLATLGAKAHYFSVLGADEPAKMVQATMKEYNIPSVLLEDPNRPTTFKIRYMVDNQKLLRVSRLHEEAIPKKLESKLIEELERLAPELDGIIVSDFVYGVITDRILETLTSLAAKHKLKLFGDLQCSSQVGNVAKFKNYHLISPTEREARIALSDQRSGLEKLSRNLLKSTNSENLLITLGASGFIAFKNDSEPGMIASQHFPALSTNPVDVAGAGDTLLASMAIALCAGGNLMEAALLGTCAAAIAVSRVGNIPISNQELRGYLATLY